MFNRYEYHKRESPTSKTSFTTRGTHTRTRAHPLRQGEDLIGTPDIGKNQGLTTQSTPQPSRLVSQPRTA
ncbi:hypothetical protein FHX76_001408 [Lysinibacter cavernae]|uniref:Uncharacterized protein n=1 Tax=Lysinibacter cavernae TaxID=1640652 RepID=A0A7X5R1B0_9MICO|nr:hypothetical protein [Lysinibacter cavernae]